MDRTFSIKTVQDSLNIKGELNLSNASKIWDKLGNLTNSIKKIQLTEIKALDVSILQQLILIKSKNDNLVITAEIPESIASVLEKCKMTEIFSSLTIKN